MSSSRPHDSTRTHVGRRQGQSHGFRTLPPLLFPLCATERPLPASGRRHRHAIPPASYNPLPFDSSPWELVPAVKCSPSPPPTPDTMAAMNLGPPPSHLHLDLLCRVLPRPLSSDAATVAIVLAKAAERDRVWTPTTTCASSTAGALPVHFLIKANRSKKAASLDVCPVDNGTGARFVRSELQFSDIKAQFGDVQVRFCCGEEVGFGDGGSIWLLQASIPCALPQRPAREAEQVKPAASCLRGGATFPSCPPTDFWQVVPSSRSPGDAAHKELASARESPASSPNSDLPQCSVDHKVVCHS
jgi:hypothetical protein